MDRLISITFMAIENRQKYVLSFCYSQKKRFLGRSLDVIISLFVRFRKSLGISIMFILLLLNEGE